MEAIALVVPAPLAARTGGTLYDLRLARELEALGCPVRLLEARGGFPDPSPEGVQELTAALAALPDGGLAIVDGLIFGAVPELMAMEARRLRLVALVHHPLAYEGGLAPAQRARLMQRERGALAHAWRVLVPSRTVRDLLIAQYGVPFLKIAVAPPGTDPAPRARGGAGPPRLLWVASLTARKDPLTLIRALAHLADLSWRLELVGSTERDPVTVRAVREAVSAFGFRERVEFCGELSGEELEAAWRRADLFVSTSRFEGYGMALAEALARGLPVVAVRGGAVAEVVPEEAALLVPADAPAALAVALRELVRDPGRRRRLAAAALRAGERLPSWAETARVVLHHLLRAAA